MTALVLSGGRSSRFGTDKSRVQLGNESMLERVLKAAAPFVDDVLVVGPWAPPGYRSTLEASRFEGPLSGFVWGMSRIDTDYALVLGCDHPLLVPGLLGFLLSKRRDVEAVVPIGPYGHPQTLVAVYRRTLLQRARHLLDEGERRLQTVFDGRKVIRVRPDEWEQLDPDGRSFLDLDWPGDLDMIEALVQGMT